MELAEAGPGFEVGVALDHGAQSAGDAGEIGSRGTDGGGGQLGAQPGDGLLGFAFMCAEGGHGGDQPGDQVVTALELDIDE